VISVPASVNLCKLTVDIQHIDGWYKLDSKVYVCGNFEGICRFNSWK